MIRAAILAGGMGSRMRRRDRLPKQFLPIGGKAMLLRTLEPFLCCGDVAEIVVAVTKGWAEHTEKLIADEWPENENVFVIEGGEDRLGSLVNVCRFLLGREHAPEDVLLTHDGARPFVTEEIIRANVVALSGHDCVTTAVPLVDTILSTSDGRTAAEIPERSAFRAVQTPQTFRLTELAETIASLTEEEKSVLTDAAKIYLLRGKKVGLVPGAPENFKVTAPKDLALANLLWAEKNKTE